MYVRPHFPFRAQHLNTHRYYSTEFEFAVYIRRCLKPTPRPSGSGPLNMRTGTPSKLNGRKGKLNVLPYAAIITRTVMDAGHLWYHDL